MSVSRFLILSCLFVLSGCFVSETPLFSTQDRNGGILKSDYVVTDGSSPVGTLKLQESSGVITVVESTDSATTAELDAGRSFMLFKTFRDMAALFDRFGPSDYYWVQSRKSENAPYDYELISVCSDKCEIPGIVFRWGNWMMNDNEGFLDAFSELSSNRNDLIDCSNEKFAICTLKNANALNAIERLILDHKLGPIRAYVPRPQ